MSLALLHSPADILATLMVTGGQGADSSVLPLGSWPVYVSGEASGPDQVLTVYDTTPQGDGRSMVDGERWQHYGIQVRVRSSTHKVGYAKARAVQLWMDETVYLDTVTMDGAAYLVWCLSKCSLLLLGKETPSSKRSLFTINAMIALRRTT